MVEVMLLLAEYLRGSGHPATFCDADLLQQHQARTKEPEQGDCPGRDVGETQPTRVNKTPR